MSTSPTFAPVFPYKEFQQRIARFQSRLQACDLDGALIIQKADLYYFSGTVQDAHLYIPADGEPLLMIRKSLKRALAESPLPQTAFLQSPRSIGDLLADAGLPFPKRLGMELDVLPTARYFQYKRLWPETEIIDAGHDIRLVRAVKSEAELEKIRAAAACADTVLGVIRDGLRPGMTEVEMAAMAESASRPLGHPGALRMRMWGNEMFFGHFMAGESAAIPSYLQSPNGGPGMSPAGAQSAGFGTIRPGDPVLADFGFVLEGYISDQTRIFSIGHTSDDLKLAHDCMLKVQDAVCKAGVPGATWGELYTLAFDIAESAGYGDAFMGAEEPKVRFVGHGVGVELDEYPFIAAGQKALLEENMVVALEPKTVFPGRGMVGIENTFIVTPRGMERISAFPDEICRV